MNLSVLESDGYRLYYYYFRATDHPNRTEVVLHKHNEDGRTVMMVEIAELTTLFKFQKRKNKGMWS